MALTEYRLQDLARISGVSARNIRAYRERGLLDPPRREGRSAFYDAYHLAQLQTINDLLARGFTSAHIAEFFETMRSGRNLTEVLGLQYAILRTGTESDGAAGPRVDIDPRSAAGQRLIELGLAQRAGSGLEFTSDVIGRAIARSPDPVGYVEVVLQLVDATHGSIEVMAAGAITALKQAVAQSYGSMRPSAGNIDEMTRLVSDFAGFTRAVIADQVERALRRRLVTEISDFNASLMASGQWQQREES
ncbi:MerR family transcriptional regulator [Mycobacterium sp. C31M]